MRTDFHLLQNTRHSLHYLSAIVTDPLCPHTTHHRLIVEQSDHCGEIKPLVFCNSEITASIELYAIYIYIYVYM